MLFRSSRGVDVGALTVWSQKQADRRRLCRVFLACRPEDAGPMSIGERSGGSVLTRGASAISRRFRDSAVKDRALQRAPFREETTPSPCLPHDVEVSLSCLRPSTLHHSLTRSLVPHSTHSVIPDPPVALWDLLTLSAWRDAASRHLEQASELTRRCKSPCQVRSEVLEP